MTLIFIPLDIEKKPEQMILNLTNYLQVMSQLSDRKKAL